MSGNESPLIDCNKRALITGWREGLRSIWFRVPHLMIFNEVKLKRSHKI